MGNQKITDSISRLSATIQKHKQDPKKELTYKLFHLFINNTKEEQECKLSKKIDNCVNLLTSKLK